jgi:L-ascorbate metabolism protein UlaG (beta-lactamase superfamily)
MLLTKFGHSCVRLEDGGARLLIDPGIWSGGADPFAGAGAVLITHEHADHVDVPAVRAALDAEGGLELWTNGAVAAQFEDYGERVHAVGHGDSFTAAGFDVRVYGSDHAMIHPDVPVVPNIGFAVGSPGSAVFHPGDSFTIPDEPVRTLLLPVTAPWLKVAETVDYARAVRPAMNYAIHDAIANANGLGLIERLASLLVGPSGGGYAWLEPGTSVEV